MRFSLCENVLMWEVKRRAGCFVIIHLACLVRITLMSSLIKSYRSVFGKVSPSRAYVFDRRIVDPQKTVHCENVATFCWDDPRTTFASLFPDDWLRCPHCQYPPTVSLLTISTVPYSLNLWQHCDGKTTFCDKIGRCLCYSLFLEIPGGRVVPLPAATDANRWRLLGCLHRTPGDSPQGWSFAPAPSVVAFSREKGGMPAIQRAYHLVFCMNLRIPASNW